MSSFTHKEKIVFFVSTFFAIILLGYGIFNLVVNELPVWEFVNVLAVSLIFLGTGLSPKVFFTPFKQLFSLTYKPETIINIKANNKPKAASEPKTDAKKVFIKFIL